MIDSVENCNFHGSEIAIIGMTGRFPGAKNLDEFWQNLKNGNQSISFFTEEELLATGVDAKLLNNPNYVKASGILADAEFFDAEFFGFSPKEAEITDIQHRVFLECAWEALENAGYSSETYPGVIGVYAGSNLNGYLLHVYSHPEILNSVSFQQITIGGDKDYLTTRVSYKLNLTGPSYTIQTACSTSLVAVHLACQSLLSGECDLALAGGVAINARRKQGYLYQEGGVNSPDGYCRAFDAKAQGTVGGEGVGIVVLKRLEDALQDKDTIHAIIKGSAINNDGANKVSYTAPRIEGQAKVIRTAQIVAEVEPETITYVEAHGTGTSLGDPIEIAALTQAFQAVTQKKGFCAITSLKTNIGHLDAAAGVAGLIKTVLALKHKEIPPSLHFEKPNPQIDFGNSPFYVNTTLKNWEVNGIPRRAGVSSFGIGGTNAHVILEEAPPVETSTSSRPWQLLVLSAKTATALETATTNLANHLQQNPHLNLADVAHTLQMGRKTFDYRRLLVCQNLEQAVQSLKSNQGVLTHHQKPCNRSVVFMFPGQGAQYANMAAELYQTEPVFADYVNQCAELLKPHLGLDIRQVIYPANSQTASQLSQTALTQPALFVIEYALAQLWMSWGVHPEAMIGHSIGEYVAATLAGVFSLEDALQLVATRGRLMQTLLPGAMLSVQMAESEIQPLLGAELALAASNSPSSCVVSGAINAIAQLEQQLQQQGINSRRLHTSHAFHSPMMEAMIEPFTKLLRQIPLHPPQIPFISNVSGTWISAAEATDSNYWAKHIRQTVHFNAGIIELLQQPERIFLEVGPGRTLSTFVKQHRTAELVTLTSIRHPQEQHSDIAFLLTTLGRLWLQGIKIDWSGFYIHEQRYHIPLPTYPFERQRYWIEPQKAVAAISKTAAFAGKKPDITDWFYIPSWKRSVLPQFGQSEIKASKANQPKFWLVFVDECGLGEKVVQQLEIQQQNVITVRVGEQFERQSDRSYTINPQQQDDYKALFQELRTLDIIPKTIIHLWSVTPDNHRELAPEKYESRGFYSLLFLAQALGEYYQKDTLHIGLISNNMQMVTGSEELCPEKALIIGPCKTIPQEYSNITCCSIDVVLPLANTWQQEQLINQLLTELSHPTLDQVIAYRGHHRWVQDFEPIRLDGSVQANPRLREKGVYLITGGLGGVGLALAEYLAQTVQAKLILIGRSPFPQQDEWQEWLSTHDAENAISQKIRKLQNLEAIGAEIMVVSADVANYEQMSALLTKATQQFGQINGVIHAAAVPGGGMIQIKTQASAADALAPKVQGTRILEALFHNTNLDIFILCSSLSAFTPTWGMVDYIAENAFLDVFSHYSGTRHSTFTTSINWDRWNSLGMAVAIEQRHKEVTGEEIRDGMSCEEGVEAFRRILCSSAAPQVVVSTQDIATVLQPKKTDQSLEEQLAELTRKTSHPRPNLANAYVAPRNELEATLADIWQQLLGIKQVGIHDNFFELGGDSLFATQLVSQLCKKFQIELPYKGFFNSPTISELAETIAQKLAEQADQEELAKALAEIEQLSDDEIHKILGLQEQLIETGVANDRPC